MAEATPFKIIWSVRANNHLQALTLYLTNTWGKNSNNKFIDKVLEATKAISHNPNMCERSKKNSNIRGYLLSPQSIMYYRINAKTITILKITDTRSNPKNHL
jgi:plasmid stabilization system protein ParE